MSADVTAALVFVVIIVATAIIARLAVIAWLAP